MREEWPNSWHFAAVFLRAAKMAEESWFRGHDEAEAEEASPCCKLVAVLHYYMTVGSFPVRLLAAAVSPDCRWESVTEMPSELDYAFECRSWSVSIPNNADARVLQTAEPCGAG